MLKPVTKYKLNKGFHERSTGAYYCVSGVMCLLDAASGSVLDFTASGGTLVVIQGTLLEALTAKVDVTKVEVTGRVLEKALESAYEYSVLCSLCAKERVVEVKRRLQSTFKVSNVAIGRLARCSREYVGRIKIKIKV